MKLGSQARGTIDLPIAASAGHKVKQLLIHLERGDGADVRVLAITDDGTSRVIIHGPDTTNENVPPQLIGERRFTLRIEAANPHAKPMLILTALALNITIAPL